MPTPIRRAFTGVTVPQAPRLTRRQVLAAGAGLALGPRGVGAAQPRRCRVLLNYGNALMVSRRLLTERPDEVRAFVRAVNRGLAEAVRDLDAAIGSVAARDRTVRTDVDRPRLAGTLAMEMAHPEGARLGIGDVDDGRLSRGIALIAKSRALPRVPAPDEIFTRSCLPPSDERITMLAR